MIILSTERTTIDSITVNDASFFVDLVNTPDWLRFIGDRNVMSTDDATEYLKQGFLKSYAENGFGYYLVKHAASAVPMGICGFLKKPALQNPDFGFAFLPDFFGQGFATEACQAVLDFGIKTYRFTVLDAVTAVDNKRSIRLLEKLGFEVVGTTDDEVSTNGQLLYRLQASSHPPTVDSI